MIGFEAGTLGLAFLAGMITVLSPCVLPLLPVILSASTGQGPARPWGVMTGFIGSYSLATLGIGLFALSLGLSPDLLRWISAGLLGLFGLVMAVPPLKHLFETAASGLALGRPRPSASVTGFKPAVLHPVRPLGEPAAPARPRLAEGFWAGLGVGAGLGLAWTPCVGPLMASVISLALNQQVSAQVVGVTLAFAVGTALPMTGLLLGGQALMKHLAWFKKHSAQIQQVFGILLVGVSLALSLGGDRWIQTWLLDTFPGWESALTSWEL